MFNLPVKLALLSEQHHWLSPQNFLDWSPQEGLALYLDILSPREREALDFAFSARAILLILEKEFEVRVAHQGLVFVKTHLDSLSWLYANGLSTYPDVGETALLLDTIAEEFWLQTVRFTLEPSRFTERAILRDELSVLLMLYYHRYAPQNTGLLDQLHTFSGMRRVLSLAIAEAIYKADGAKVLFGPQAPYTRLWEKKQHQLLTYIEHLSRLPYKKSA